MLIGTLAVVMFAGQSVMGATLYWDADETATGNDTTDGSGLGGTGLWDTTTLNWWDGADHATWPDTNADVAIFTGPLSVLPVTSTVTVSTGIVANQLRFDRSGYTLEGGDITLAGATPTLHANMADTAAIDSEIKGTDGLTKTGGGTMRLGNNSNSYTGLTSIANGILVISGQGALGTSTSAVVVQGSATRGVVGGSLVLDSGAYGTSMDFTRDLVLQGYGPIADRGSALISIGDNTVSGAITYAVGNVATGIHSVGGMLTISGPLLSAGTTATLRFGAVNGAGVGSYHVTGALNTGTTGSIEKQGGGTLILDPGSITFDGTLAVNGGSVRVSNGTALGTSVANGALTLGAGTGTLEVRTDAPDSFATRRVQMSTSGTGTLFLDHTIGGQSLNQTVQFAALTLTAGSTTRTLAINSRNGYGLTFNGNSVGGSIGGSNTIAINANGLVTFDGNFWNNTSTTARTLTMTVNTGAQAMISGSVIASGAAHILTKTGVGTLTILGDASTYTGATNVQGGTLAISSFGSINNNTAAINISSTTTAATLSIVGHDLTVGQATTGKVVNLAGTTGGATILANQTGTSPGLVFNANFTATGGTAANAKTLTLGGSNTADNIINGIIPNNAAGGLVHLTKIGSGTWVLGGANTFTGSTTVSSGTLKIRANAATSTVLQDASAITFGATGSSAGATLAFAGQDGVNNVETLGALSLNAGANTLQLTPGAGGTASLVFSSLAAASGAASLNILGSDASNTVTLTGVADGLVSPVIFFNGSRLAYAESGVLRAAVYGVDAGFLTTTGGTDALNAIEHWEMTGDVTQTGDTNMRSLRIVDSNLSGTNFRVNAEGHNAGTGATTIGTVISQGNSSVSGLAFHTAGSGALVLNVVDGTLTLNALVHGNTTGGLTKTGAGTLVIAGVNNQTGATTINEGTVQLALGGRLSANSQALVLRQGATLDLNGVSTATSATASSISSFNGEGIVTNTSANAVLFAVGGGTTGGTGTFNGTINEVNGQISVVKMGTSNSQTWNGLSNYTGSTTIGVPGTGTSGSLSVFYLADIGQDSSIGRGDETDTASNAASLVFGGTTGGLTYVGDASLSTDRLFTLAGTGATITNNGINNAALIFRNTNAIAFSTAAAQTLTLAGSSLSDNWFNPQIVDNGAATTSLVKDGAGLWILGNATNSYTGPTTILNGVLQAQDGSSLPTAGGLIIGGATTALAVFESSGVFTRELGTGANTVSWTQTSTTGGGGFSASTDKLVVAIGGLGTETELVWGDGSFVPVGTGAGAALVLNSTTALAEVEFRNAINLNGATRVINVQDNTSTFTDYATISGVISGGTSGITKTGNGVLQLRGANTYDGVTAVTAGTLVVDSLGNSANPGASSVGDSTNGNTAASALTLGNGGTGAGILQYIGAGEISDRMIRINTTTGSTQIHADGSGALILTNVLNDMVSGTKTLFLRGSNAMGNMITSDLTDNGVLNVTVDGGALWILAGTNTFTGTTTASGGTLGIGSDTAAGAGTLSLNNGTVFAHAGDRTLGNAVSHTSNTNVAFIGEYSLTLNGTYAMTGTGTTSLTVTLTNNIAAGKALTLNGDVTSAATAARTWSIIGSGDTVLTGDLITTAGFGVNISYTGSGTLTLHGSNTTGGNTTAGGGVLIAANNSAFGTGNVTLINTNAVLELADGIAIANNLAVSNTGNNKVLRLQSGAATGEYAGNIANAETTAANFDVSADTGGVLTLSGVISGVGGFEKTGDGIVVLTNGGNTYAGTATVSGGILRLDGGGVWGPGAVTIGNGVLEIMSSGVDQTVGGLLTLGASTSTHAELSIAAGRVVTLGGQLTYTASNAATANPDPATITGLGTLALGADKTITVNDNLSAVVDLSLEMGTLTGSGTLIKAGAGTLDIRSITTNSFSGVYQVNAGAILGLDGVNNNLILNGGVFAGSGTFTRALGTGNDQVQWGAAGGGFAAVGGALTVTLGGAPDPLVWGGTANFVPDGAPLIFGSTSADAVVDFTHNIDLNGTARTVSVVNNLTTEDDRAVLSGVLSNGGITKTGNGVLRLGGANTFTGGVTVTTGILEFETVSDNGGGSSNLGAGTDGISMGGGTLSFIGSVSQATNRAITLTATSTLDASGGAGATITYHGAVTGASTTLTLTGTGEGFLNGALTQTSNTADLTKNGSGTWTLNATSTIADDLLVNDGVLNINVAQSINDDFVVTGTSTVVNINAAAAFTGDDMFIRGSLVKLGVDGALNNTMDDLNISIDSASGSVLDVNGTTGSAPTDLIMGSDVFSGSIIDTVGTGSIGATGTMVFRNGTVSANLTGAAAMTKNGNQIVILSGNNVGFTGSTTMVNGTLILDYTANNGEKLSDSAAFISTGGGNVTLNGNDGSATSETLGGLTLNAGALHLSVNHGAGQTATLNLGAITRSVFGGTVEFNLSSGSSIVQTSSINGANAILGGYATVNGAKFATVSGGAIQGFDSTVSNNLATWQIQGDLTDSTGYTGTVSEIVINSLRFHAAGAASTVTVAAGANLTIASGGILVTSNVGSGTASITGGTLASGTGNELMVHQNNSASVFTIGSSLSGATALTKSGLGTLVLSGVSTNTGQITINEGTVLLLGGNAIGDGSFVTIKSDASAVLDLNNGSETIAGLVSFGGTSTTSHNEGLVSIGTGILTLRPTATRAYQGRISGTGTLIKTGTSTQQFLGNHSEFTGTVIINQGLLDLSETSLLNGVTAFILNGSGELLGDQDVANVDHIGNTATITLNNTGANRGLWFRNPDVNSAATDTVGDIILGAGHNVIQADNNGGAAGTSQVVTLAAASLTRTNHATLLVRGQNLGGTSGTRGQIVFTGTPGGIIGGGGAAGTTTMSIAPYIIGEAAAATGDANLTDNFGNSFVFDTGTTNGLRPLNLTTEYILDEAGFNALTGAALDNVRFAADPGATLTGDATQINSLVLDSSAGALTVNGPASTLHIKSGAILATTTVAGNAMSLGGFTTLTTDTGNDFIIYVTNPTSTFTLNSALATVSPLVKSGAGTLSLTNSANAFTDAYLNQGFVQVDHVDKLGTGGLRFRGGGIKLAPTFTGDIGAKVWDIGTGGGFFDASLVTGGYTLANGIHDSTVNSDDVLTVITRATGSTGTDGLLTIQGASTFTGTTVFNHTGVNSSTLVSVLLNGVTNQTINGNIIIGNTGTIANDNNDVTVGLGADEQIVDTASITFNSTSGEEAYFKLFGFTETVAGISAASRGVIESHESATDAVAGDAKLIVNSSEDFSFTGFIRDAASSPGGTLAFEKQGTGTQTLVGASITYTGLTTITGGTLHLQGVTAWNSDIVNNSLLILNETATRTHIRDITGTGSVIKTGSADLSFAGGLNLTYQGSTTVKGGTMTIGSAINGTTVLNVINSGSTLALTGGIGNASAITSIVVEHGATLSLLDGTGNKLNGLTNLQLGSHGGTLTTLNLNVGDVSAAGDNLNTDLLTLLTGGTLSLFAGNQIMFNLTDAGLNPNRTYNLISAVDGGLLSILSAGDWLLGATPGGFTSITLNSTGNLISITTGNLITGDSFWTGLTDNAWNGSANNWSTDKAGTTPSDSIPGQGTDVVFVADSHAGGALVTTLEQNFKVNSLRFESSTNTPSSVTIAAGAIATSRLEVAPQVDADGVEISAGGPAAVTISAPFKIGAAQTWHVADAGSILTFSGGLQGEADVTKTGAGKVIVSAVADPTFNTGLTTDFTVSAGILEITNAGALGTAASSNAAHVIIGPGAVFYYNGVAATVANDLTLAGGTLSAGTANQIYSGAVNVSADSFINLRDSNSATLTTTARNITLSGAIAGSGGITLDSINTVGAGNQITGSLVISGANGGWSGDLNILRGLVLAQNADALGSGGINIEFGKVEWEGAGGDTYNLNKALTIARAGGNAVGEWNVDRTSGTDVFTVNNSGTVTLGGAGGTGELRIFLADADNTAASFTGSFVLANDGAIHVRDSATLARATISGVISETGGSRSLIVNGPAGGGAAWGGTAGILRLTGANTFTGNVTIVAGTLEFDTVTDAGGAASSLGQGNTITMGAATLNFIGSTSQTTNRAITTTGSATLNANGTGGAAIEYTGAITQATDNVLTLGGTGEGKITGGITQGAGTTADLVVAGGTWTIEDGNVTIADDLLVNAGTLTLENMVFTLNDDVVVTGTTAVLNLNSTGVWAATVPTGTSSGLHARTGGVINLNAHDINGAGNGAGLDFINVGDSGAGAAGVLNTNGFNITTPGLLVGGVVEGLEGHVTGTGTITVTSTATDWSLGIRAHRGSISANLAGVASLLKQGAGDMILSGDNSGLTGTVAATRLDAGNLILDYTTNNNNKISAEAGLDLRGGGLILLGNASASTTQVVTGLAITGTGSSRIVVTHGSGQTATLNVGGITRSATGGTVDMAFTSGSGIIETTAVNGNGAIFAGWATANNTQFATVSGGQIAEFSSTVKDDIATWLTGEDITDSTGYTGVLASPLSINSLRFGAADAVSTVDLGVAGNLLVIASGGILVTPDVDTGTASIIGGTLIGTGGSGVELFVHQHNTAATFTIGSRLVGTTILTKAGDGVLELTGLNTSRGDTNVNAGTLVLSGGFGVGAYSTVVIKNDLGVFLDINGGIERVGGLAGGGTVGGKVLLGSGTLISNTSRATQVFVGTLEGTGTFIKSGINTQELEGDSINFTGDVIVNGGLLHLDNANGAINQAASITLNGAELLSDQDQTGNENRIGNATVVTLNNTAGTRGLWLRNENQNATRADTIGTVVLGSGHNVIQATTNAGTNSARIADMVITNFLRGSDFATGLVRGQALGSGSGARGRIRPATAPAGAVGGGGAAGTTNLTIIPYLIGAAGVANAETDANVALEMGNSFVTWVSAGEGLRPLNLTTEYVLDEGGYNVLAGVTTANVRFATDPAAVLTGGSKTINSLVLDSSVTDLIVTGDSADVLTLASGALLATTTTPASAATLAGFAELRTGTSEYIIYVTNATGVLTIDSALTSAASLTKSGAGILALTSLTSTYNGGTWFNQGLIQISDLGALGSGDLHFFGGGLRWAAGATFDPSVRTMIFGSGGAIFDTNGNDVIINNAIGNGGSGGLTKTGNGVLTLNAAVAYTGPTTVNQGTLLYGVGSALGSTSDLVLGGGTFDHAGFVTTLGGLLVNADSTIAGAADLTFTGNVEINGATAAKTLTVDNTGLTTFDGAILTLVDRGGTARAFTIAGTGDVTINSQIVDGTAAGSLVISSTGTTTLNGSNTYTGTTSVNDGVLRLNTAQTMTGALNFGSASSITTAGTLEVKEDSSFGSMAVLTNSGTNTNNLVIDAGRTLTINGNVIIGTGVGALSTTLFNASGGGTLIVNNAATNGTFRVGGYTGGTAGQGNKADADFSGLASLQINLDASTGVIRVNNTSTANTTGAFATLKLAQTSKLVANLLTVGDGGQYNNGATHINTVTLGSVSNTFHVNSINIGNGARDYGAILFDQAAGTLTVRAADGLGRATFNMATAGGSGTGTVNATGNTFDVTGHDADLLFDVVTVGAQNRGNNSNNSFSFDQGVLDMNSLVMARRTANPTTGTAANWITNSTVNLGGGAVNINDGISSMAQITGSLNAATAVNATINISGGVVNIGQTGGTSITMASASVGTATAVVNITGGTTTLAGDVVLGGGAGTTSATVTLNGGILEMNGHNIGAAGQVVTLDAQSGTLKNLGELNGGGTLTKSGSGLLVIEGANGYTGGTNITDGTVELRGSLSTGAVTVSEAGGTLANAAVLASAGNGTTTGVIGGAVTIGSVGGAGILKVGGSTGDDNGTLTLTASGTSLTVMDGSQIQLGITSPSTASTITFINGVYVFNGNSYANAGLLFSDGTDGAAALAAYNVAPASDEHDYLNLTGSLDMSVGDRAGASWGEGSILITPNSFNLANVTYGQVFNLIDWMDVTGSISGSFDVGGAAFVGAGSGNVSAGDIDLPELGGNYAWDVSAFQSHGILVVVPEPSRALLLLGGLLAMFRRRRR